MKIYSNSTRLTFNCLPPLAKHIRLQCLLSLVLLLSGNSVGNTSESVVPLISGFDQDRIAATYPPTDENKLGELAKLLYRLRAVDPAKLQSMATQNANELESGASPTTSVGDAAPLTGTIKSMQLVPIPKELIEFLEFKEIHVLTVQITDGKEIKVMTFPLPQGAKAGDRLEGAGIALQVKQSPENASSITSAILCNRLRWLPTSSPITGWQLLRDQGVDISLLAGLGTRNRQTLLAEDGDAFYSMMAAASDLEQSKKEIPTPSEIAPVTLLQGSSELTGQWIRMNLETVLITRISVTEPRRQAELGSDHYYQIDAVGDLGNVVVQIERPAGDTGPPASFNNRYPVSVVTRSLPVFLEKQIQQQEGGDAVISELKTMIQMDGFFFRLWSYETDFMAQHGGGNQFGPLVIAAEIRNKQPATTDTTGVNLIGSAAACAVILGIFGIWAWQRRTDSRDRAVRDRKKEKEAESLRIP
jgi:hypothetical protein